MASLQGLPSALASMQLSPSNNELSTFEKLPKEIRRKICEHLLKAEMVRGPPDDELVCHYKFETSILAVSKHIHQDTWPMLYRENQFVTVLNNWDPIFTVMNEYEVAPIASSKPKEASEFKKSVLHLHLNFLEVSDERRTEGDTKYFLLVAPELPRFVGMLRVLKNDAGTRLGFNIHFGIQNGANGPPSLVMLKAVMEPFHLLGSVNHKTVQIEGITDLDYAKLTMDSISPSVKWLRGTAWGVYELVKSRVEVAEKAYGLEKWQKAWITYREAIQVMHNGCYHNHELNNETYTFNDDDFFETINLAYPLMESNTMLIRVRAKEWDEVLRTTANLDSPEVPPMSSLVRGRMYLYRAIALAAKDRRRGAIQAIRKAFKAKPSDPIISDFATMVALSGLTATRTIFSDTSIAKFKKLLPLQPAIMNPSVDTARERHVLLYFGYKGNYLPAIKDKRPLSQAEKTSLINDAILGREEMAAREPGAPLRVRVLTGGETQWQ